MLKSVRIVMALVIALAMVSACKGKKEEAVETKDADKSAPAEVKEEGKEAAPEPAEPTSSTSDGINTGEVLKVLDAIVINENALNDDVAIKMADDYAGLSKNVNKAITKDVFIINAGSGNTYNLKATKPAVVFTIAGSSNNYNVTKAVPFDGEVLFVTHQGFGNTYTGAKKMTVAEFRKKFE